MCVFFFQAEVGIRYLVRSRGLGDVYKRQVPERGRKRKGARPSFMQRDEFEAMAERERAIHSAAAAPSSGIGTNPDPDGDAGPSRGVSEP